MNLVHRVRLWVRALFRSTGVEAELDEELRFHLELEIEKNVRAGLTAREARRKALVDFGGVERFKEETRDARLSRPLEDWLSDIRLGFRGLRSAPGFTAVAILTLGIGIGANTAIFSVVSGVLLNALPYHESESIVYIDSYWTPESGYDFPSYPVGSPEYFDYRAQNRTMAEVAAISTEAVTITEGAGDPEVIRSALVSPSMFAVLRSAPLLGRTLVEDDGGAVPEQVVVLSHDLWQRRFGGDSAVVGQRIGLGLEVADEPVRAEIVGVMPAGFGYPDNDVQLWAPLPLDPARTWRGGHWFDMIGRLAPGVTLQEARLEMATLMNRWAAAYPDHHQGHGLQMKPLLEQTVGDVRPALLLLLGSVGFVLLIACSNVASLLLARAEGRRREVAVRNALGAGRRRIFQQIITESFLLAVLGGVLGLAIAWASVQGLLALEAGTIPRVEQIGLDVRVLGFTGGAVLLTTLLFGMMPAFGEIRPDPASTLREAGLRQTATKARMRFRKAIVVFEVTLSVLLVVQAGLMVRSFRELLAEEPGFRAESLLFARFSLPAAEYEPEQAVVFFDELLDRARALPGVADATITSRPPLLYSDQGGRLHIEGREAAPTAPLCCMADGIVVGDGYFETFGIPLIRGRLLQPSDHRVDAPPVVVVDQAAVDRWWPGEDPIGQRVRFASTDAPWATVVGVVGNATFDGPGETWPHYFLAHNPTARSHPFITLSTYLTLRTASGDPATLVDGVRRTVAELDADLAIAGSTTIEEIRRNAVAEPRFIMALLSAFAIVALLLGAIGIYGVMSYGVALRFGEIGIRRALGARGDDVVAMVLQQGLRLAAAGLLLGLAGAVALTRFLASFLHEVSPTDLPTYLAVVGVVAVVALLASYGPARRAAGVDPLEALRIE